MTDWSAWLGTVEASRILEMPRRSTSPDRPADVGRRQRLAAVVSAYHGAGGSATGRQAVVFGWHRVAAGAPIEVFTAAGARKYWDWRSTKDDSEQGAAENLGDDDR